MISLSIAHEKSESWRLLQGQEGIRELPLPTRLGRIVDWWLTTARPRLLGGRPDHGYLFFNGKRNTKLISSTVCKWTKSRTKELSGVGLSPGNMRTLTTTHAVDFIKGNEELTRKEELAAMRDLAAAQGHTLSTMTQEYYLPRRPDAEAASMHATSVIIASRRPNSTTKKLSFDIEEDEVESEEEENEAKKSVWMKTPTLSVSCSASSASSCSQSTGDWKSKKTETTGSKKVSATEIAGVSSGPVSREKMAANDRKWEEMKQSEHAGEDKEMRAIKEKKGDTGGKTDRHVDDEEVEKEESMYSNPFARRKQRRRDTQTLVRRFGKKDLGKEDKWKDDVN